MSINSRQKGKVREREACKAWNAAVPGACARRGQQRSGVDCADVIDVPGCHVEVKGRESLNVAATMKRVAAEAKGDAIPVLWHKKNRGDWLVTLRMADVMAFVESVAKQTGRPVYPNQAWPEIGMSSDNGDDAR